MSIKPKLPTPVLLFAAGLVVLAVVAAGLDRAIRPAPSSPADEQATVPDLGRAMTFTPPPEPRR